jgi:hypothetical protein
VNVDTIVGAKGTVRGKHEKYGSDSYLVGVLIATLEAVMNKKHQKHVVIIYAPNLISSAKKVGYSSHTAAPAKAPGQSHFERNCRERASHG